MQVRARRSALGRVVAFAVALAGASPALAQLRPEPGVIDTAPPELVDQLRANPVAYFRFVNRSWIARVCAVFAEDIVSLPTVRLHGDAHVEQFAVTGDAWGLDDFDDSIRGPAIVDIVRFLGSIDLAAGQRGWSRDRDALFDRFLAGYRRGVAEPDHRSAQPAVVGRLRAQAPQSRAAFLAWGETMMKPMDEASAKAIVVGMDAVSRVVHAERPDLPAGYMAVVRAGWLRTGIGSALSNKVLIRIQGASAAPDDDELVEAKELRHLGGFDCLEAPPPNQPALRVIVGAKQVGRLKSTILAAGPDVTIPEIMVRGRQFRDWWLRSWDWSYRELRLDDLRSVQDLDEIVYDAGLQLGGGALRDRTGSQGDGDRQRLLASLTRLERKIRQEASRLVEQLRLGWQELKAR